jgi:hypothetical protein
MAKLQRLQKLVSDKYFFTLTLDNNGQELRYYDAITISLDKNNQVKIKVDGKNITISRFIKNLNYLFKDVEFALNNNYLKELNQLLAFASDRHSVNLDGYTLKDENNIIKIYRTKENEEVEIKKDDFLDSIYKIAEQVAKFKECFKEDIITVEFDELVEGYNNTPFYSCMQKKGDYFRELEGLAKFAKFYNNGEFIGRAILWNIEDVEFEAIELKGLQFLDRIYTKENHINTKLILEWCSKNNIVSKQYQTYTDLTTFNYKGQIIESKATLNVYDTVASWDSVPYMDTFRYFGDNRLVNEIEEDITIYSLDSTGGYYNDVTCCECCNRVIPSDEIDEICSEGVYSEFSDGLICSNCLDTERYVFVEDLEDYIPINQAIFASDVQRYYYDDTILYKAEDTGLYYTNIYDMYYIEDLNAFREDDTGLYFTEDTFSYFSSNEYLFFNRKTNKYYEVKENFLNS